MPSIARALAVLGLVVLAAGSSVAAYGVYEWQTDTCESGHGVSVDRLGPNETPRSSLDAVAYENLSAPEQRAFRDALGDEHGSSGVVENWSSVDGLSGKVVVYEGDRYETAVWVSDCPKTYGAFVVYGSLAAAVGGVVAGGASGWRRLRQG